MNTAFPSRKTRKNKKHDVMMEALKEWIGKGPLGITPLGSPTKARSKMVSRISSVETGAIAKATAKIGSIRPR